MQTFKAIFDDIHALGRAGSIILPPSFLQTQQPASTLPNNICKQHKTPPKKKTMPPHTNEIQNFQKNGAALFPNVLTQENLEILQIHFEQLNLTTPGTRQSGLPPKMIDDIRATKEITRCAQNLLGASATIVRIIEHNAFRWVRFVEGVFFQDQVLECRK